MCPVAGSTRWVLKQEILFDNPLIEFVFDASISTIDNLILSNKNTDSIVHICAHLSFLDRKLGHKFTENL